MLDPYSVIDKLNCAYHFISSSNSKEDRKLVEKDFYQCHDWLRKRNVKFHLTLKRQWVIDDEVPYGPTERG